MTLEGLTRELLQQTDEQSRWYKDAIIYELHVRAFADSNGDGIGDFRGLASKLGYLQDLGVTTIWLLPFYPSPLKDDGYDIADYTSVHPSYGSLRDFRQFLKEAHRRGLRVITELVVNHTSDQHPWFRRARTSPPGSPYRDFYVWSDTPEKYQDARIIFKDFEQSNWTWDPVAKSYYWHRFYSHQPDLNYDSSEVRKAIKQAMDFWLEMGVDGLRLDAVPYLYERQGTNCENLPETHAYLKNLRSYVDRNYSGRMLLAEANQWPEDSVAYFGNGDECHMAFHFPVMPRMFMSIWMEDRFPILDILAQTPTIPESCQWALFLRNHDELTLEMVTDEERDYMYRVYAHDPAARINLGIRRRLAPLLGNHRRRIELMNGLLFSLPGTPVIYYGDEIGMGDNVYLGDRNGVRTPMQWSADRNAGFSQANPQRLYLPVIIDPEYHSETVHVEAQQSNPHSLLWWMKRLIALRKRFKAFGRGSLEFLSPENRKILAFVRRCEDETILVVANLSRFVQYAELNLSEFRGMVPIEAFGRTEFPPIGDLPYLLTLGPHAFYWFSIEPQRSMETLETLPPETPAHAESHPPVLSCPEGLEGLLERPHKGNLEGILQGYVVNRRWYGGKARVLKSAELVEAVPVPYDGSVALVAVLRMSYTQGDPDNYVIPLALATGPKAEHVGDWFPHAVIARARLGKGQKAIDGVLHDATWDDDFARALLDAVMRRRRFKSESAELAAWPAAALRHSRADSASLQPTMPQVEQSNTSVLYGDRFIMKLFRRVHEGVNPELEIGRFLTEKARYEHVAPLAGALELRAGQGQPMTLAVLQGFVPNEGDAWSYTLDDLGAFYERVTARPSDEPAPEVPSASLLELSGKEAAPQAGEMIGAYLEMARLLARRTAELHLALASDPSDPAFAPEPFTTLYQRSLYQSMRSSTRESVHLLRGHLRKLPEDLRDQAQKVLDLEGSVLERFRSILDHKIDAVRLRCHGDYHLGQVLYTGKDFVIIDFEGEPARSLGERRIKRSPLRDVAGMIRSFHYAARTALHGPTTEDGVRPEDLNRLEPWADFWFQWVSATFLKSYLDRVGDAPILPRTSADLATLLDVFLLEKAIYELSYELNNRPTWARVPLQGILQQMES